VVSKTILEMEEATELTGFEYLPIVQGGVNKKALSSLALNIISGIGRDALVLTEDYDVDEFEAGFIYQIEGTETYATTRGAPTSGLSGGDAVSWTIFTVGTDELKAQLAWAAQSNIERFYFRFAEIGTDAVWSSWFRVSPNAGAAAEDISFDDSTAGLGETTVQGAIDEVVASTIGWFLGSASYSGKSISVNSQSTNTNGLRMKSDGTKMYVLNRGDGLVYQYSLATAWDVSTASYDTVSFSANAQVGTDGTGLDFGDDGEKMYLCADGSIDAVFQYTLSTPWDLSTASYDTVSFASGTNPEDISLKTDGTKMYINSVTVVRQYTLSTPWDLSTASYDTVSLTVSTQDNNTRGLDFSSDGKTMVTVGQQNVSAYQYHLSTAWDLSTAAYAGVSLDLSGQLTSPRAISFSARGGVAYIVRQDGNNTVYQYYTTETVKV
jgi:hypothetical protein